METIITTSSNDGKNRIIKKISSAITPTTPTNKERQQTLPQISITKFYNIKNPEATVIALRIYIPDRKIQVNILSSIVLGIFPVINVTVNDIFNTIELGKNNSGHVIKPLYSEIIQIIKNLDPSNENSKFRISVELDPNNIRVVSLIPREPQ